MKCVFVVTHYPVVRPLRRKPTALTYAVRLWILSKKNQKTINHQISLGALVKPLLDYNGTQKRLFLFVHDYHLTEELPRRAQGFDLTKLVSSLMTKNKFDFPLNETENLVTIL